TWYEVCIPPGKTAKFDYSDVDFCGNTSVQRWNGTSWEDYRHWNWNGSPPNNHREIDNVGTGVGKVRLHNDNYDQDGFQVSVSIDPPTKQTSPDNREEFATVSLGGRDGRSCEFGNIVATTHVFAFEQGALYSDFPGTLGEGGVDNLEIEFESYDNPYWSDMQLMISCVSVSEPLTLSLAIPDADVPLTTADILPGETVCYLNPGGINAPGYHTMTISLATSGKQPATLTIDAFNFSSLVWTMFYHLDYGDAPDSYLTLGSSNGARHGGDGLLRLGNLIDFELDGQPSPGADGDDLNNEPDEDGVLFLNPIVAGENMNLKVFASAQGYLSSWIDLTGNGTFTDAGEKIFSNILLTPGWNTLSANITPNARVGITYIRFRFCSTAGLNFFGLAADGEVEDYRVNIYPAGWGYIPSPVTHLILIPLNVGLNANLLNPDDILGVFYTDEAGNLKCGGASAWDGTTNQVLIANGDDITTIGKTGFAEDEELQWRLFKVATGTAQWIDVTYDPAFPDSDGKFSSTGLSALASLGNFYDLQIFSGWSGLSTYFIPSNTDIVSMMNPIVNDLIILYNITGVYWPSQNINTLITWNIYKGHVIKVSDDVILTLAGQDITNKTVSLVSGWNLIPVFSQSSSTSLLGGLPGFVVAKGVATNEVYWPAYNINTMPYLNVGKAYYVYTTQAGSITYAKGGEEILWESPEMIASTPWNDIAWSPNAHLVAFTAESLKSLQNGDMLAAFTPAGRCAGAAVISDVADPAVLIINGDDPTTPTLDGFQTDDQLNFRVYREQTNETFELEVIWDKNLNHSGLFETNGLSSVVIMKTAGLRKTEAALFDFTINPNPSKGIFNIKGSQQIDEITISNLFGETILSKQMSTNEPVDLRDYPDGIYFIRISSYGKVFFSKLVKTNL
ncbi:MAG: T9SS type A sorting domain-containing protein, partial [Bacteroidales bacterium]|nr:T9SS type A sorting domain-containing protein [Bacteroidales bacterium]